MAQIQAKKFRTEATECQLNAEKAEPTDQEAWLRLAEHWMRLAETEELIQALRR
jgi:hypothetical protein